MVRGERVVTLFGDHAKHMNHSDEGAELTCDYYSFDLDAERKLGERGRGDTAPAPTARA